MRDDAETRSPEMPISVGDVLRRDDPEPPAGTIVELGDGERWKRLDVPGDRSWGAQHTMWEPVWRWGRVTFDGPVTVMRAVVIGAGSPETSALTHCPTCGAPEWHVDGRRGWNPVDVECEDCAGTYSSKEGE